MWERLSTESEDEGGARQVRRPTARRGKAFVSPRRLREKSDYAARIPIPSVRGRGSVRNCQAAPKEGKDGRIIEKSAFSLMTGFEESRNSS